MKFRLEWIVIGILVISLVICGIDKGSTVTPEEAKLQGEYEVLKTANDQLTESTEKIIKNHERKVAELMGMVDSYATNVSKEEEKVEELKGELKELKRKEVIVDADKGQVIINLKQQMAKMDEIHTLALHLKDVQIADGETKLGLAKLAIMEQKKIIDQWKETWDSERTLRINVEKRLGLIRKRVRRMKTTSTIKTIAIGLVASALVYDKVVK